MYVPRVRERVRVEGHDEIYQVVHVDNHGNCADLACVERVACLMHVPLDQIRPAAENHPPPSDQAD